MSGIQLVRKNLSIASLLFCTFAHAGDMGGKPSPSLRPYFGGEVSYSWIQANGIRINGFTGSETKQHWGGRLSAGVLRFSTEKLGFTSEVGGGYYGSQTRKYRDLRVTSNGEIDGYDILVGALYKLEHFDLFAKIGFMVENIRVDITKQDLSLTNFGITGSHYNRLGSTQVLPEIRVGGIYNLRNDLGVTLTYMHAFGSTPGATVDVSASQAGINSIVSLKGQNPSLDSVLLGLRYYIP